MSACGFCRRKKGFICVTREIDGNPCDRIPPPCGFYGQCLPDKNGFICECDDHWGGSFCDEFNHCNPNPCENGGTCHEIGNHFECSCNDDFHGKICNQAPCEKMPCGNGVCTSDGSTYNCDCSATANYGDNCEFAECEIISCGPNGQPVILYEYENSQICACECYDGFDGSHCENQIPSKWGENCKSDLDCNQEGQKCDDIRKQCLCDTQSGYILNEFQAELSYGECVGPVTPCMTSNDCNNGQNCNNGRCSCDEGVGELCLKNGAWECVLDPLPPCQQGILPNGNYGCCDQIENWSIDHYLSESNHCENYNPDPTDPCILESGKPSCGYYGLCTADSNETFSCSCFDNWSGDSCNIFDPCEPSPCLNDGICRKSEEGLFTCECQNDFSGDLCEKTPCEINPCGAGRCIEISDGFACDCSDADVTSFGENCEIAICSGKVMKIS